LLFRFALGTLADSGVNKGFLSAETQIWVMHIKSMYKILGEKKKCLIF
jgi:hypothetical protein